MTGIYGKSAMDCQIGAPHSDGDYLRLSVGFPRVSEDAIPTISSDRSRRVAMAAIAHQWPFSCPVALPESRRYLRRMIGTTQTLRSLACGIAAVAAMVSSPVWAAPQVPLAAGTYAQLSSVMAAADQCGFRRFRVGESAFSYKYLYTDDDLGSYPCIESWLKKSAQGIGLAPRYEGDVYER